MMDGCLLDNVHRSHAMGVILQNQYDNELIPYHNTKNRLILGFFNTQYLYRNLFIHKLAVNFTGATLIISFTHGKPTRQP